MDMAKAIAPHCKHEIVGIRPDEKIHEVLITKDDARHILKMEDCYVVEPEFNWWSNEKHVGNGGKLDPEGFRYASEKYEPVLDFLLDFLLN